MSIAQSTTNDTVIRRRAISKLSESGDPRAKGLLETIVGR
jgi:hypothetical protein